ncbi:transketolase family protein [Achromobacter sp. UMC46]|uniref:transketolase family protein n=1 Tax=Achromobacter sp. UMC46 TaxID=1862319 RepID=UPI001602EF7E|nr:transketolase [Achromobacter sp. UMC46]MBB1598188.1 transketolase [Achromobacter sp. UMC46]
MRKQLCDGLVSRAASPDMVFLTGDLGFMALEPLQDTLGKRFINAGVAEQNMVSVAAAMAREGLETWIYSIAPFCYARPFEQIRNDITFHKLPVKLIGNGGGYGYGVMGPTHHAIEDYGILLTLPHMRVYIPAFDEDVQGVLDSAAASVDPAYIRLGRGEAPAGYIVPDYAPWRQLIVGNGMTVIVAGPLAGTYLLGLQALPDEIRPNLWVVTELPLEKNLPPPALIEQLASGRGVCVAEEHVRRGGFGSELALWLLDRKIDPGAFHHLYARAHHYATYGSQGFLRKHSGLDASSVLAIVAPNR